MKKLTQDGFNWERDFLRSEGRPLDQALGLWLHLFLGCFSGAGLHFEAHPQNAQTRTLLEWRLLRNPDLGPVFQQLGPGHRIGACAA